MIGPLLPRIGLLLARIGMILPLILTLRDLLRPAPAEIKPNQIYDSTQAARYLGLERREVVKLLRQNKLQGKLVDGNYRILGKNILEYLEQ